MFGNLASALRKKNYLLRKTGKNFQKKFFYGEIFKKKRTAKNTKKFSKKMESKKRK
jgi:hypothetical protein